MFLVTLIGNVDVVGLGRPSSSRRGVGVCACLVPDRFSAFSCTSFLGITDGHLTSGTRLARRSVSSLSRLTFGDHC